MKSNAQVGTNGTASSSTEAHGKGGDVGAQGVANVEGATSTGTVDAKKGQATAVATAVGDSTHPNSKAESNATLGTGSDPSAHVITKASTDGTGNNTGSGNSTKPTEGKPTPTDSKPAAGNASAPAASPNGAATTPATKNGTKPANPIPTPSNGNSTETPSTQTGNAASNVPPLPKVSGDHVGNSTILMYGLERERQIYLQAIQKHEKEHFEALEREI